MCGILMICFQPEDSHVADELVSNLTETLNRRGPDLNSQYDVELSERWRAKFYGYTLWLQGSTPCPQPLVDPHGNILLWNGDIFYNHTENDINPKSDTAVLLEKLEAAGNAEEINSIMENIKGPWSFIYYVKKLNMVVTGRDRFGRHSLLWNCHGMEISKNMIVISSYGFGDPFREIPASSLFTISFSEFLKIEPTTARNVYSINSQFPSTENLIDYGSESTEIIFQEFEKMWGKEVDFLETVLRHSVQARIECQPKLCKKCVESTVKGGFVVERCLHPKLAVLFSGGLDSAVLAALADQIWPLDEEIDLLNVAFQQKINQEQQFSESFAVPDRYTGFQALEELRARNPLRKWNFVQVNIPLEELADCRKRRIASLIYPSSTVLDDSIGCAQWFAARGEGKLIDSCGVEQQYVSPARVVLMGAGADEQLGGYARHRQRFANGSWSAVISELEMEMKRISERNLGRDNRIIADHGRAPRLPYLDENVVAFLADLPVWIKADLRLPVGVGDKMILRCLAYRLGLIRTASEPKRAIQFGSRIAKAESRKEKGSQKCDRL